MNKDLYLKIRRPADRCLICDADLVDSRKHPSAIRVEDAEEEPVQRADYCTSCWRQIEEKPYFSFWMAKREEAPPERTRISKAERNRLMFSYFEHLGNPDTQEAGAVDCKSQRFFLAHLLMRFRVFRWVSTDKETQLIRFENIGTGDIHEVESTEIDDESVVRLKQEVENYLRKGEDVDIDF